MPARTQTDIVARIARLRVDGTDLFGFREEVLLAALGYAHAREFLPTGSPNWRGWPAATTSRRCRPPATPCTAHRW